MMTTGLKLAVAAAVCLGTAGALFAADPAPTQPRKGTATPTVRASKLEGLSVRNPAGEKLGSVNDLVIDLKTGKVNYVAMSFGGILGIGDKLFAVPFDQVKLMHDQDNNMFYVLNVSKERLKEAPGFDQSNWPDFADPHWSEQIDKYYRVEVKTRSTR